MACAFARDEEHRGQPCVSDIVICAPMTQATVNAEHQIIAANGVEIVFTR
jgi:hypothetical protein